ncbi:hypothetical protein LTR08_007781 [Meristemomyces frigidus]|nr:hypothetical protein LTR08_007781 [Meristemomyces frigidus]
MPVPIITPQPATPNPPWGGFLTRVCGDCERMIRSQQNYSFAHLVAPVVPPGMAPAAPVTVPATIIPTPKQALESEDWPWKTCTCRYQLGMPRLQFAPMPPPAPPRPPPLAMCHTHREKKLRELEKLKDDNDKWLRDIARHPEARSLMSAATCGTTPNAVPGQAPYSRKELREANGNWRACRCGNEVDISVVEIEAWVCMACEGWWSFTSTANSKYNSLNPANLAPLPGGFYVGGPPFLSQAVVDRFRPENVKMGRR